MIEYAPGVTGGDSRSVMLPQSEFSIGKSLKTMMSVATEHQIPVISVWGIEPDLIGTLPLDKFVAV